MTTSKFLDAALKLAKQDKRVFPVGVGGKVPYSGSKGVYDATSDPAKIKGLWIDRGFESNIAMACGQGFIVIDLDVKAGVNGIQTWHGLCEKHNIEGTTLLVNTPSGGRHLYYKVTGELKVKNSVNKLGPGIDIRAMGGYVLVPPSMIGEKAYTWVKNKMLPLPTAIEKLLNPLVSQPKATTQGARHKHSAYVDAAIKSECEKVAKSAVGQRNDVLNKATYALGTLVGSQWAHLDLARAENVLLNAALTCGLPDAEARKTIASGLAKGATQPRLEPKASGDAPPLTTYEIISLFEKWGYKLCLNEMTDDVEHDGEIFSDEQEMKLIATVRDHKILQGERIGIMHAREAMVVQALDNCYHPVRDYLNDLTWDGKDHITELIGHFSDKVGFFEKWFRHWIVGAVAKVFEGFQNPMLVIDGPQAIGKSYFARWLCPPGLARNFYAGAILPDSKDCRLRQRDCWLWEVQELGATTRRADLAALKAFLTTEVVRDRKPYGRRDVIKPAVSNFLGTINSDGSGFLIDRTGNRRFLVCQVEKIDWGYPDAISIDQLWAQAVQLYTSKSAWFLTGQDMDARDTRNEEFMIDDPIESFLGVLFEYTGNPAHFVTLPDVCDLLADRVKGIGQRSQAMTASRVFQEWGAVKKRTTQGGQRVITYLGVKVL